jgi:hypothetical protein
MDIIRDIGTSSYAGRTLLQVLNNLLVRTKVYVAGLLIISRVFYSQPPAELELKGEDRGKESFFRKALHHHQPNTYLNVLGLDPIEKAEFYHNPTKELILSDSE